MNTRTLTIGTESFNDIIPTFTSSLGAPYFTALYYDPFNTVDSNASTFLGLNTDGSSGSYFEMLFNTGSSGQSGKFFYLRDIVGLKLSLARGTGGDIKFLTEPSSLQSETVKSISTPFVNPNGVSNADQFNLNINPSTLVTSRNDIRNTKVYGIRIGWSDYYTAGVAADARVHEITFSYKNNNPYDDPFEFNDSVLTTDAWNSSRYNGKQLRSSRINRYNTSDSSYKGTPVIRNNSRTIYIANELVSLSGSGYNSPFSDEDNTLHRIPGFSYVTINQSITIDQDDNITVKDINNFIKESTDSKSGLPYSRQLRGFERELQTSIPIGSTINLKLLDDNVIKRPLKDYPVFFNQGKLRQILIYANINDDGGGAGTIGLNGKSDQSFQLYRASAGDPSTIISGSLTIDEQLRRNIEEFYTGSISNGLVACSEYAEFLIGLDNYKDANTLDPSRRAFITPLIGILSGSAELKNNFTVNDSGEETNYVNITPIFKGEVINTNNSASFYNLTGDLKQLSTFEVLAFNAGAQAGAADLKLPYNTVSNPIYGNIQKYRHGTPSNPGYERYPRGYTYDVDNNVLLFDESDDRGTIVRSELNFGGSYSVSLLDNSIPSLLIPLNKELEYPNGTGRSTIVVLPENLHPYIKDNLIHFLAKAGFDLGDRNIIPSIDKRNVNLS